MSRAIILLLVMLVLALAMLVLAVIEDNAPDMLAWGTVLLASAFTLDALAREVRT